MKRISSYQRLKQKKLNAEPYSSRAKNVRAEIKLKYE
jgi:hypothetical protein